MGEDDAEITQADAILRLAGNPSLKKLNDRVCFEASRISMHDYELQRLKGQIDTLKAIITQLESRLPRRTADTVAVTW